MSTTTIAFVALYCPMKCYLLYFMVKRFSLATNYEQYKHNSKQAKLFYTNLFWKGKFCDYKFACIYIYIYTRP